MAEITLCAMPYRIRPDEAQAYRALRTAHCVPGHASEECSGRLIIDRNGITLACPRCGDARGVYASPAETSDEIGK